MSDGLLESHNAAPELSSLTTAGSLLRAARESQGLHIAALAVSLKVPVKKLEALEADRIEDLPDAVFARALASSVCRALKVDVTPILEKLPLTTKPRLNHAEQSINAPFRSPGDSPGPGLLSFLSKPSAWAVMALLVGALVLVFMPDLTQRVTTGLGTTVGENGAGSGVTTSPAIASEQAVGSQVSAVVTPNATSDTPAMTITSTVSTPTVSSPTLVISTTLTGNSVSTGPLDGLVVFKATGETWVEVTDAKGQTTLRRILQAGEGVAANGKLPLRVTVGRADQTQVTVRGQAYDLAGKVRDNVARFEVK